MLLPARINPRGDIVGYYADTPGYGCFGIPVGNHGFLRSRDGSYTTLDVNVPGVTSTQATGSDPSARAVAQS